MKLKTPNQSNQPPSYFENMANMTQNEMYNNFMKMMNSYNKDDSSLPKVNVNCNTV